MCANIVGSETRKGNGKGQTEKDSVCGWFTSEDNIFVTYESGAR